MTETKEKNTELAASNCGEGGSCAVETSAATPAVKAKYKARRTDDAWEIGVLVPGVKREDVSVSFEEGILGISAKRHSDIPENWRPVRVSTDPGEYRLRLELPTDVDLESTSATLENGVLSLRLPFAEAVKPISIEVT